ncbi:MarR family winged helix-turn-helix transcriptional regulator [Desulfosporosinus sp. PR]|uniref:MarR family winged helix-turn-helix transcriptional regulator n=1 Tax=Candidatus Desulfosporosinus nitrosoreducens TaxID=3401928 RepID=UPI0027F0F496|nr:MarR family winged helix-turn-helix transcriptional regulator [Desulfosporosinus sp. PR]MDQ7096317.1 MarR family winged helix-turn-helix transcriptional regulator [Desulfosporosinus sp. PR]
MNQKLDSQALWSNPSEQLVFLFKAVQKIYRDQVCEKSKQYGFTGPQVGLILALSKHPYITLNELSECIGLSKSTVSGIVNRLVNQGVVIREIPENNRRIVRLSLTPEFQKNNVITELINNYIADALKAANEEDLQKIITGLEILYELLSQGGDLLNKDNDLL